MTEKQKQAIRVLNNIRAVSKVLSEKDYFLLLDFIIGQPPNIPFQREEPFKPMEVWYDTNKNYEPDGIFGPVTATTEPTMMGQSATSGFMRPVTIDELHNMPGGTCKNE